MAGHCLACHTDNVGHSRHLRQGDCRLTPSTSSAVADDGVNVAVSEPPGTFESLEEQVVELSEETDCGPPAFGCHGIVSLARKAATERPTHGPSALGCHGTVSLSWKPGCKTKVKTKTTAK